MSKPVLNKPKFGLKIYECEQHLLIEQNGERYLAHNWRWSDEVRHVVDLALSHDLTCMIRNRHPSNRVKKGVDSGVTVDHLGFSITSNHDWAFVLDLHSSNRDEPRTSPTSVTFNKKLQNELDHRDISYCEESNSAKNLIVKVGELGECLRVLHDRLEELTRLDAKGGK